MDEVSIGIIGSGDIVNRFSRAVKKRAGTKAQPACKVRAVAVYSRAEKCLGQIIQNLGGNSVSIHEIANGNTLGDGFFDGLDAVYIASPNYTHFDYLVSSMLSGKHALLEKPVSNTLDGAMKSLKFADAVNTMRRSRREPLLAVGDAEHYSGHPLNRRLHELFGKLVAEEGTITHVEGYFLEDDPMDPKRDPRYLWLFDREKGGGGVLIDTYSHMAIPLSIKQSEADGEIRQLFDKVLYREAFCHPANPFGTETAISFHVKFADSAIFNQGATGRFDIAKRSPRKVKRLILTFGDYPVVVDYGANRIFCENYGKTIDAAGNEDAYDNVLSQFLGCVTEGMEPLTPLKRSAAMLGDAFSVYDGLDVRKDFDSYPLYSGGKRMDEYFRRLERREQRHEHPI